MATAVVVAASCSSGGTNSTDAPSSLSSSTATGSAVLAYSEGPAPDRIIKANADGSKNVEVPIPPHSSVESMDISRTGSSIAVALEPTSGAPSQVFVVELATGATTQVSLPPDRSARCVRWSADGDR